MMADVSMHVISSQGGFRMIFRRKAKEEQHPDFPRMGQVGYDTVLAALENHLKANWYLEIGSRTGSSLRHRKCNFVAIDPEFKLAHDCLNSSKRMLFCQQTSDEFFADGTLAALDIKPDLAFVDGLHLFEYALRDFMNIEAAGHPGSVICIHDVCPFNYDMTTRDLGYLSGARPWTGDVWKLIVVLARYRPDLDISLLDCRKTGLAVVRNLDPDNRILTQSYDDIVKEFTELGLQEFGAARYYGEAGLTRAEEFLRTLDETGPRAN